MKENLLNRPTGALPHSVVSNITDEGKLERQESAIGQDKLLLLHKENILLGDIPLLESRKELTRQKAKFRSGSGTESRCSGKGFPFLFPLSIWIGKGAASALIAPSKYQPIYI